jgi:hypothetical protein
VELPVSTKPDALEQQQVLRRLADLFHEIGSSLAATDLVADCRNAFLAEKLRENIRTPKQLRTLTAEGFELCVLALAASGASDVTIHECGKSALGEEPWGDREDARCTGDFVHDLLAPCPVHDLGESDDPVRCTGTILHGEFTPCPAHDWKGR